MILLTIYSCEKFEGDQTIPAYLHIDTIYLADNPQLVEGYLTHDFTDIWVYVDDQIIGAFELPATIPILANGPHKLSLYAGVKYNGISTTRGAYLFTQPRIAQSFEFTIDSIIYRNPTVMYYDNSKFLWIEDFESTSIGMKETSNSDTTISLYNHSQADPALGLSSGIVYLDSERPIFEATSFVSEQAGFDFPSGGQPVFLEIEYNTNNLIVVGIFVTNIGSGITQHPILVLSSSEGVWKKVYVNLSPSVTAYNTSDFFNVYIRSDKESEVDYPVIKLDNLKLINRVAY